MGIVGATLLVHRRLFNARVRNASSFADNLIIVILWLQLALGLGTIPRAYGTSIQIAAAHGADGEM